ncbi:hypothetical protein B0H12DRAFT_1075218 [Mycena haematopus]|nr:hypothetical protein B0H12DRAFT_1075218 [Mycena haematopus]
MFPIFRNTYQLSLGLNSRPTAALADHLFGVDFHPPLQSHERDADEPAYDKERYDESVYTTDDSTVPYQFVLFGKVCTMLLTRSSHSTFGVASDDRLPDCLKKAFACQIEQLAQAPVEDESSFPDTRLVSCIGVARDAIFVHTDHLGHIPALIYRDVDGTVVPTRTSPVHFPADVGEWVVIQATFHRRQDSAGVRKYEVLARHIRVLGTTSALLRVPSDEFVMVQGAQGAQSGELGGSGVPGVAGRTSVGAGEEGVVVAGEEEQSVVDPDPMSPFAITAPAEHTPDPTTPKKRARENGSPPAAIRRSPRIASNAAAKAQAPRAHRSSNDSSTPFNLKRGRRGRKHGN